MNPRAEAVISFGLAAPTALMVGAVLGWVLWPPPAPTVAPRPAIEGPRKPAPLTARQETKATPLPYDLVALKNASSQQIAQFEAWLVTATCDEVMRLLVGRQPAVGFGVDWLVPALILDRFGEFSAAERLAAFQQHLPAEFTGSDYRMAQALQALAKELLPARAAEISNLLKRFRSLDDSTVSGMLGPWAQTDFDAAKAFAESLPGVDKKRVMDGLFFQLAEADLAAAMERALILPAGEEKTAALTGVARIMALDDLAGALQWLNRQGLTDAFDTRLRGSPFDGLLSSAAWRDPVAAAECVLQNPGLFENPRGPSRVGELFKTWAAKDFAAAQAWLAAHPLPEKLQKAAEAEMNRAEANETRAELAQLPLESAVTAWQGLPASTRDRLTEDLVQRLVAEDPSQALDRIAALVPEEKRAEAMNQAIHNLPQEDRKQILRWLPELAGLFRDDPFRGGMLSDFPPEDLQAAMDRLPAEDQRSLRVALAEQALTGGAVSPDPERAPALLPEIDPHAQDPFLYSRIAVEMANTDPKRAAAWVAEFPEGNSKEWAARNLVANWAKFDPEAAAAWVEKLPAGASRDRSNAELAYLQALAGDRTAALRAAGAVRDEGRRAEAYGFALQNLWWRDPAAAELALSGANLSSAQRDTVSGKLKTDSYRR